MKKYKLLKISNSLYGRTYRDERKDYIIAQLKDIIKHYRYFPERLKDEIYILEDFINTFRFINNTECFAYKLELLKQIYYTLEKVGEEKCLK